MNHSKVYVDLIKKRRAHPLSKLDGYREHHHIVPASMGGLTVPSNMIYLTGREHWVAHLLLFKIHRNREMAQAVRMMSNKMKIKSSRVYESVRILCAKAQSEIGKQRVGKKNGSFGTRWICNVDLKENKKISKEDPIPNGWSVGRSKWNEVPKQSQAVYHANLFNERQIDAVELWEAFKKSKYLSAEKFAPTVGLSPHALRGRFKRYISEYKPKERIPTKHALVVQR